MQVDGVNKFQGLNKAKTTSNSVENSTSKGAFPKELLMEQIIKNQQLNKMQSVNEKADDKIAAWDKFVAALDEESDGKRTLSMDDVIYIRGKYNLATLDYQKTLDFVQELNQMGVLTKNEALSLFEEPDISTDIKDLQLTLDDDLQTRLDSMGKALDDFDRGRFFSGLTTSINTESIIMEQLKRDGKLNELLGEDGMSAYNEKLNAIATLAQFSSGLMLFS